MRRFKSVRHCQLFCSIHDPVYQHFKPARHRLAASTYRRALTERHKTWNEISSGIIAASRAS